ncbi:MAG: antibiotic biosynthesis monooxygenase [Gemmataceae bacterium]|nr:antibiotic biosynthesis monooxygenase [Gemmataceae bacterium]
MKRCVLATLCLALVIAGSTGLVGAGEKDNPIVEAAKASVADPKKPFTMVVMVEVKEGQGKALEDLMKPCIAATRKEKGCIAYDLNRDPKDATKYHVYERWQSVAALEHHMQTEHIKTLLSKLGDVVAGPPEVKFYVVAGE